VTSLVAWRILTHEKGRSALATSGIFIALLMIFLQLGFYSSVPKGGMLMYDAMRFDLLLTSSAYVFQGESFEFPRRRLYQAWTQPEVVSAVPVYQGEASWLNEAKGLRRDIFIMAFKPADRIFAVPDIERQLDSLRRADTVLVDSQTLPAYGPQTVGRRVEIGERTVEIAGNYRLGTGFVGLGALVMSDLDFLRLFPERPLGAVNLGLLRLRAGSDPDLVAGRLRASLPDDTRVFTRAEIREHEEAYWQRRTATGLVFGFGVIVSIVVGIVILYQTLSTQIARQLSQYATLKAIGYTDGYLGRIVVSLAVVWAGLAFIPALAAAIMISHKAREMSRLPIEVTSWRVAAVLLIALTMSAASALVAVHRVRRADPADVF
jgi:putative ABC transport system permease protein